VAKFSYSGMTLTNQNCILKDIKRRLNSGNSCYHAVQNLLSSHLLFKNIKIKIILPFVLYRCETLPLILRDKHILRVFEDRMLKEYLDLRGTKL
jgi:hypothetical protein